MAKKWKSAQVFGSYGDEGNVGKIPYDKETEAKAKGTLTGVGKPKELKSGDHVIIVTVQPTVKVGESYKYTFSVNSKADKAKQEEYREKMLSKGYAEQPPVFIHVKYKPDAADMHSLLTEMKEMKEGKKSFNAVDIKYSTIKEKDKEGNVKKTVSGADMESNFAASIFMAYPPDREAEFSAILDKHLHVKLWREESEEKAPAKTTRKKAPAEARPVEVDTDEVPMEDLDYSVDIDIPF